MSEVPRLPLSAPVARYPDRRKPGLGLPTLAFNQLNGYFNPTGPNLFWYFTAFVLSLSLYQTCNRSSKLLINTAMTKLDQLKRRTRADYPYILEYRTRWYSASGSFSSTPPEPMLMDLGPIMTCTTT